MEETKMAAGSKQPEQIEQKQKISDEMMAKIEDLPPFILEGIKDRLDAIPLSVLDALVNRRPLTLEEKIRYKIPFSRHELRRIAIEVLYQHLLLKKDIRKALLDTLHTNNIDGYLYALTIGTVENEDKYIDQISHMLRKDWSFDRLSMLEQAILLMAFQDIEENGIPKAIAINEAVGFAKQYCDDESYKLINGVLDQL